MKSSRHKRSVHKRRLAFFALSVARAAQHAFVLSALKKASRGRDRAHSRLSDRQRQQPIRGDRVVRNAPLETLESDELRWRRARHGPRAAVPARAIPRRATGFARQWWWRVCSALSNSIGPVRSFTQSFIVVFVVGVYCMLLFRYNYSCR